jgi:hypothetical protein
VLSFSRRNKTQQAGSPELNSVRQNHEVNAAMDRKGRGLLWEDAAAVLRSCNGRWVGMEEILQGMHCRGRTARSYYDVCNALVNEGLAERTDSGPFRYRSAQ